jgi:tRNA (adenine37-N6)-methyltransferase
MEFKPIGTVFNRVREAVDSSWGEVDSEIRIVPELASGVVGLGAFSHALVVFLMHQAEFTPAKHLTRHPQDRSDVPLVGIFAQRARHRPNPIGVTTVQIERIERGSVHVRGLDAIDGTPVLDIKPHVVAYDSPSNPREPEWMGTLMRGYF